MNFVKTGALLMALNVLLVTAGGWLGGPEGVIIALGLALFMNIGSYWFSDKIVLRMYRAQPITPQDDPEYHRMVERLCQRAGLPMPKLYIIPDPTPNAFATGRNPKNSAVAVNQGLLRLLSAEEVEGVVAHELAHIRNRDTLISAVAATIAGAITMLAHMAYYGALFAGMGGRGDDRGGTSNLVGALAMMIIGPMAAMIIQMAISRTREYAADRAGAEICGRPLALADALRKLEQSVQVQPMNAEPSTAHMFIVNPLKGQNFASLFRTHPSTSDRIARLEAMAQEMGHGRHAYSWK
jgi:heat shock protein HtpX